MVVTTRGRGGGDRDRVDDGLIVFRNPCLSRRRNEISRNCHQYFYGKYQKTFGWMDKASLELKSGFGSRLCIGAMCSYHIYHKIVNYPLAPQGYLDDSVLTGWTIHWRSRDERPSPPCKDSNHVFVGCEFENKTLSVYLPRFSTCPKNNSSGENAQIPISIPSAQGPYAQGASGKGRGEPGWHTSFRHPLDIPCLPILANLASLDLSICGRVWALARVGITLCALAMSPGLAKSLKTLKFDNVFYQRRISFDGMCFSDTTLWSPCRNDQTLSLRCFKRRFS
ncbi:hypothetical protein CR513_50737, partial [Mucuna pruriens]